MMYAYVNAHWPMFLQHIKLVHQWQGDDIHTCSELWVFIFVTILYICPTHTTFKKDYVLIIFTIRHPYTYTLTVLHPIPVNS